MGSGNSRCKGPEAGVSLVGPRSSKEVGAAGTEYAKVLVVGVSSGMEAAPQALEDCCGRKSEHAHLMR